MEDEQDQIQTIPVLEVQVEVFIPNLQIMPDEIHEDELMDNRQDEDAQLEEDPPEDNFIQLGFVE